MPPEVTERIQVRWFRPTWPSDTSSGCTPSIPANRRWNPIATLHSPTARWSASSRARVTMPTGLVKSMIQASGFACSRIGVGHAQDDGHGAQRLRETAGSGGLLPDAVHLVRPGLVAAARVLPADPQLDQHRIRVGDTGDEIGGADDAARMPGAREHALRDAGHQVDPLLVGIDQPELLQRKGVPQSGEAVDELGGVGGATPDEREFHSVP